MAGNNIKVSVIVPTIGRPTLGATIDSILAEDFQDREIVVIAESQRNATLAYTETISRMARADLKLVIADSRGPAKAKNIGLRLAQGRYVTFLDDDDIQTPTKLATLSRALDENPQALAAFGVTGVRTPEGKITGGYGAPCKNCEIGFSTLVKGNYIGSGSIMLRMPIPGFDETLAFGEDYFAWMRIAKHGPIIHVPEIVYYWTQDSPDGIGKNTPNWQELDAAIKERASQL